MAMSEVPEGTVNRDRLQRTLLCVEDVAQMFKVAPQTVYKWVRTGYIPHFKLGSAVRFSQEAVLEWLKTRESKGRKTRLPSLEETS